MTTFVLDPSADIIASVPRSSRQFQGRQYRDKQFLGGEKEWQKKLEESSTVYVGNLSYYTNEYQLYELFSRCGSIKRIIMGLQRMEKTPCGFCFVEYDERKSAVKCVKYLNKTYLDGREILIDIDAGFQEGRQYGRGASGGQVSDDRRRERESGGSRGRGGANSGSGAMLTRSITIVACLTMISLILIAQQPAEANSAEVHLDFMPFGGFLNGGYNPLLSPYMNRYDGKNGRYVSLNRIRQVQITKQRTRFEKDLAAFLVNLMKSAKPTLLKAFIKATLADKQLKETAIGLFFGSSDEDTEESDDKDKDKDTDKEKEKDDKDDEKKSKSEDEKEKPQEHLKDKRRSTSG